MEFEGKKGKFEVGISAAVRGCERSRGRMIEGIIFLLKNLVMFGVGFCFFGCRVCFVDRCRG